MAKEKKMYKILSVMFVLGIVLIIISFNMDTVNEAFILGFFGGICVTYPVTFHYFIKMINRSK